MERPRGPNYCNKTHEKFGQSSSGKHRSWHVALSDLNIFPRGSQINKMISDNIII